ncbi:MAG TPA: hypothetical protein ENI23_17405 [bacterium]|nr:hypothetical protein [bacterium]
MTKPTRYVYSVRIYSDLGREYWKSTGSDDTGIHRIVHSKIQAREAAHTLLNVGTYYYNAVIEEWDLTTGEKTGWEEIRA